MKIESKDDGVSLGALSPGECYICNGGSSDVYMVMARDDRFNWHCGTETYIPACNVETGAFVGNRPDKVVYRLSMKAVRI